MIDQDRTTIKELREEIRMLKSVLKLLNPGESSDTEFLTKLQAQSSPDAESAPTTSSVEKTS